MTTYPHKKEGYGSSLPIGLSDEDIRELAKVIDHDRFFDIGVRLGFESEELQTLGNEYAPDDYRASVELLSRWRINPIPETATKETLQRIIDDPDGPDRLEERKKDSNFNSSKIGPTSPTEFEVQEEHHGRADGGDAVADEALSWSSARLYKNLLLLSISFFFVFSAFQALSNLQSSINCDAGLGLASLAAIYATIIVSALFIPSVMIRYLGLRWTLAISMVFYALYTVANFYPSWATLMPASVLLGLAGAPLWTAQSLYLTTIAGAYAKLSGESELHIAPRFWGIFFFIFQLSQIIGNLISSLVFQQDTSLNANSSGYNCGAEDCYIETGDVNETSYCNPPDQTLTYILLGIYLFFGVIAILIIIFLSDNIPASRKIHNQGTCDLFLLTLNLMKDCKLLLLIPLTIFTGMEQAFITGDFTKSYVTCSLNVGWVGYVMICFGAANAISSILCGRLAKYTGQIPIFCLAALLHTGLLVALYIWEPKSNELAVFFIISALWGVADAALLTQINALFGILFKDDQEPAFSNLRLWQSVGFTISFAYSNFLCVWIKIIILWCILGVSVAGYLIVEMMVRRQQNKWNPSTEKQNDDE